MQVYATKIHIREVLPQINGEETSKVTLTLRKDKFKLLRHFGLSEAFVSDEMCTKQV